MRKTAILLTVATLILAACNSASDLKVVKSPVIAIKVENAIPPTVYPGAELEFLFSFKYDGGITAAYAMVDGEKLEGSEKLFVDSPDYVTLAFTYKPSDLYAGNTIDFSVFAEGNGGAKGHYDYPVFILAAKPEINISIPTDAPNEFLVDGSVLSFDISITSATVDMMQITTYKGDAVIPEMSFPIMENPRNVVLPFRYEPTLGDTSGTTTFTVEVMDVNGNLVSANYSVIFTKPASDELNEYYGVVMGLNRCTTAGQFFDAVNNKVYTANGVGTHCADIDWALFWSNNAGSNGVAFAAPVAGNVTVIYPEATIVGILGGSAEDIPENWTTRNETNFRDIEIDADTFAGVSTVEQVMELYEGGVEPTNDHVTFKKVAGSTIAFKINRTSTSSTGETVKYGLIRVTARQATNNTGSIVFDYKIEK